MNLVFENPSRREKDPLKRTAALRDVYSIYLLLIVKKNLILNGLNYIFSFLIKKMVCKTLFLCNFLFFKKKNKNLKIFKQRLNMLSTWPDLRKQTRSA